MLNWEKDMFGSLALTGAGHGTPDAILMGIEGETPDLVETSTIKSRVEGIHTNKSIRLDGTHRIHFDPEKHLIFNYFKSLPQHPNGLRFCAFDENANMIATNEYFSIGGGFVVNEATQLDHGENVYYKEEQKEETTSSRDIIAESERRQQDAAVVSLPFRNSEELLQVCKRENMTIAQVVYENELKWHTPTEIRDKLLRIWNTMDESIRNGVLADPNGKCILSLFPLISCLSHAWIDRLPGALNVRRRAPALYKKLLKGLYNPVPNKTMYNDSRITGSPESGSANSRGDDLDRTESYPLSLSVLPKRQRKRFFLPGKLK